MLYRIKENTLFALCRLRIRAQVQEEEFTHKEEAANLQYSGGQEVAQAKKAPVKRKEPKVGRNDPCPCGSGKKYKKCCGSAG